MNIQKENLDNILNQIIGEKAWGVALGHGSFITIEFGKHKLGQSADSTQHGEWHLWFYLCSWRIERDEQVLVGCEDDRSKIESVIKEIQDSNLIKFEVSFATLDALLVFKNGIVIRSFSTFSEDNDGGRHHWMLFMPDNKVLVAGPGNYLEIEEDIE